LSPPANHLRYTPQLALVAILSTAIVPANCPQTTTARAEKHSAPADRFGKPATTEQIDRIWISDDAWQARRVAILESPLRQLVDDALRVEAETATLVVDPQRGFSLEEIPTAVLRLKALTVSASCLRDPDSCRAAAHLIKALLRTSGRSDLGRASAALHASVAYAFCHDLWEDAERLAIERLFHAYGKQFQQIGRGNPDNPFNNWWCVTHSGAGLCFLIAQRSQPSAALSLDRELQHVSSFLGNYGDAGHYYEGIGYSLYSSSHWMPLALAAKHLWDRDLAAHAPGARQVGRNLCTLLTCDPPHSTPSRPPRRLIWNDDGGGAPPADLATLLLPMSDGDQDAMHAVLNRIYFGSEEGTGFQIGSGHGHPMWTLLYYPLSPPEVAYGVGLPLTWIDRRTGLVVFRNRYCDGDDVLFAVYAKSFHGGGHEHFDAASFRLLGLGASWAHAGGQAKPEAVYQNVLLRNGQQTDLDREPAPRTGKVVYFAPHARGGSVSIDAGPIYGVGRARRHFAVAFDSHPDIVAVVAIWDEIIDREAQPSQWQWSLCFDQPLELTLPTAQHGFLLRDPLTSASLQGQFGIPESVAIHNAQGPPTKRTFSEGRQQAYPGARYLTATGKDPEAGFFTVLTLQRQTPPEVRFAGASPDRIAVIADALEVRLDRSQWFQGPLRILSLPVDPIGEARDRSAQAAE
jgi:hypothetical protein